MHTHFWNYVFSGSFEETDANNHSAVNLKEIAKAMKSINQSTKSNW